MRISLFAILTGTAGLAILAGLARAAYVLWRKEENTREKFAFAALTAFSGMVVSVLSALGDKQTVVGEMYDLVRSALRLPPKVDPPRIADHLLMLLVLALAAHVMLRLYDNWPGAISVRQFEKLRYHEPTPLISEGVREAVRMAKRQPAEPIMTQPDAKQFHSVLEPPAASLAWHVEARDLLVLRSRSYEFDPAGWHDQAHCWIGRNGKTQALVAVYCAETLPSEGAIGAFIDYTRRFGNMDSGLETEYIVASRQHVSVSELSISGVSVQIETEQTLLDELV